MDAEAFAEYESGSLNTQVSEESTEVDSSHLENSDITPDNESELDGDEFVDFPEADEEIDAEETDEVELESEEISDETAEGTSGDEEDNSEDEGSDEEVDYASEYKKLIGTPIKANGKDITIDSMDDAVRLIQMGANYYKQVSQLKPAQKVIAMLEKNEMMDESKLSFAIDLLNKNPQAIHKLVADMDLVEIANEDNSDYKPTDHTVNDQQLALDNAIKEIAGTDTYSRTVDIIGNEWDDQSREIIKKNPQAIGLINSHMASGIYDTVNAEVEKRKMLGTIPQGLSDIEAYKYVGDSLYANKDQEGEPTHVQGGQHQTGTKANVVPPIRKPSKDTVVKQKKSTSVPRGNSTVSKQIDNVFAMSEEEFNKKYGNYF